MVDRGIIFSAPMVRALLYGRKSQTRRLLKPQPPEGARYTGIHYAGDEPDSWFFNSPLGPRKVRVTHEPGDRLYVREAWAVSSAADHQAPVDLEPSPAGVHFLADDSGPAVAGRHRPSIHMPRWASRLTLTVTDVRVQRVQEISEVDAIREGVTLVEEACECPREAFASLWDTLHTKPGERWEDNPWVVAIGFETRHGNIDKGT